MKHIKKFNEADDYVGNNVSEHSVTITIPQKIVNICERYNIDPDKYDDVLTNYIEHLMGTTYGFEGSDFERWCEESDNITDYVIN